MLATVRTYIEAHHLLEPDSRVVVALSGGVDSVCLLHLLCDLGYVVTAAHCNFHLRESESERDEAFVRNLCNDIHIPLFVRSFDTSGYAAEQGISVEMAAREQRYAWFEQLRQQHELGAICVAHHMNDQAETLLLNLKRGTGLRGLAGMKPKNGFIVRPLLCVTRRQIEAYAAEQHYPFVTDSTNANTTIRRNAVRAILAAASDTEIRHMALTAERMQQYDALLAALLHGETLPADTEPTLLYELLRPYGFNGSQAADMQAALTTSGKRFETEHFTAYTDHGELRVQSKKLRDTAPTLVRARRAIKTKECLPAATDDYALFDADTLPDRLMLRHWQDGDYFFPICNHGRARKKKLQDFFSDQKMSIREKNTTWLLCNADKPEEIIWVIGHRISDPYKITDKTQQVAELQIE